ncbi:MAG: helix-turn-helix domain-containing protein, partial [Hyphomicrobium sp.]
METIVLQEPNPSRLNLRHIAQKSWGQRFIGLFRKSRHDVAVLPRNPVVLPFVDSVSLDRSASRCKQFSNPCPIAKRLDEVSVALRHGNTIGIIFRDVNEEHSRDLKNLPSHTGDMANERDEYAVECGDRLRRTREALGFNKLRRFAESTGIPESRYSKWESGAAMVPPSFIRQLRDA